MSNQGTMGNAEGAREMRSWSWEIHSSDEPHSLVLVSWGFCFF